MKKTLIKLIERFVGNKGLSFDGARLTYWKVPMILLPMKILANMQEELEKKYSHISREIIYFSGYIQGKNGCNILIQKFKIHPSIKDINFFAEQTEFVGIGKISFLKKNPEHILVRVASPLAEENKKIGKKSNVPICDFTRGLITGAWEAVAKQILKRDIELVGIEKDCCACTTEEKNCLIEIKEGTNQFNSKVEEGVEIVTRKQTLSILLRQHRTIKNNSQLKKILQRHKITTPINFAEEGKISLFGLNCLITPMDMFANIYFLHKQLGDDVDKVFYKQGKELGILSSEIIEEKFKIPKNKEGCSTYLEQIGLFGLGSVEIVRAKQKEKYVCKVISTYSLSYKEVLGLAKEPVDYFIAGFISGVLSFVWDKEFITKEIRCIAKGHPVCMFESESISLQ